MNPWIIIAVTWLPLSALAALGIGRWMRGPRTPAPGDTRVPAPGLVPGRRPPVGVAATSPPQPAPAPGPDDHGGTVTTINIQRCGRMVITDWDKGEAEIHHGECETCTAARCYLCGFYLKFDPGRGQWVPRYERCPAHDGQEVPDGI